MFNFCTFNKVTNDEFLQLKPEDIHLRRLALAYSINEVRDLVILLGLPWIEWDDMFVLANNDEAEKLKFDALKKCCNRSDVTFRDIKSAVKKGNIQNPHTICKVCIPLYKEQQK